MAAKNDGNHELAQSTFDSMDALAVEYGGEFEPKRLDALQPSARARWVRGNYEGAQEKLNTAQHIADRLALRDEQGIITSNMGRIASTEVVRTMPVEAQPEALRFRAVPLFREALAILRGNNHYYYRYANGGHGSLVCALAGEKDLARDLIADGMSVAFKVSPEPYDQVPTWRLTNHDLIRMNYARLLIPLGNQTPVLAGIASRKLVE